MKGKNMNEKLARIKKKIKDNTGNIQVFVIAALSVTTAVVIHKSNQLLEESNNTLRESNDELEWSLMKLRTLEGAYEHMKECGYPVTILDEDGKPLFDISMPTED